jgi:tetratricopeptide (TPR) repeat protein
LLQKQQAERQKQQAERQKQQAEREQRQAQSGAMCDQAAANPNDRQKPSNAAGVDYNDVNLSEALEVCQTAMNTFPGEPRYKYQYARILESSNPNLAINLHSQLTRQRYMASFDNLGSLLLKRKDYSGAIAAFKNGAQANDPDSLVSLAELIQRGIVRVPDPQSYRLALLERAAHLGHQEAKSVVEEQTKIIQQNQRQQQNQSQQEKLMLNLFGNILGSVLH